MMLPLFVHEMHGLLLQSFGQQYFWPGGSSFHIGVILVGYCTTGIHAFWLGEKFPGGGGGGGGGRGVGNKMCSPIYGPTMKFEDPRLRSTILY